MGIPSFYRWLSERYPLSIVEAVEEKPNCIGGVEVPVNITKPNPNGYEFDNLYIDMNGIVHQSFHPQGLICPGSYDEVFKAVFKYIDKIFTIVRPRKLLYMAIDGVAPRAKMNQQRSRRFRAAKEAAQAAAEVGKLAAEGMDSNVITPGTEFMEMLSSAIRYYVHLRMNEDPGWQGVKVIISDANVPGEGEHKIMSYIRSQRNMPGFDPNTRHCMYGLDADLIMLALATHEIHFSILREDVRKAPKRIQNVKKGEVPMPFNGIMDDLISSLKFQFLNVWVLREYLVHELRIPDPTVQSDFERLIDDFVFMCLFVGNDFLPHVPSLEISEGAIDLLMFVYKKEFVQMGGYLTNSIEVNLDCVEHFVQALGFHEDAIFRKRSEVKTDMERHLRCSLANQRKGKAANATNSKKKNEVQKICGNMVVNCNFNIDKVKLGEKGCKERYYVRKFEVSTYTEIERIKRHAVLKYIEGICWVMHYYYQGVCSWQWFYPYHYAPFASDFYGLNQLEIDFTLGEPLKPFDQLMGVLPAARKLMTDPSSTILDFYPSDFELDMNGKRFTWQAICKLPFIDESRLLSEIAKVESTLTDEEKQRNSLRMDFLFVHITHPLVAHIFSFQERKKDNPKLLKSKVKKKINPKSSDGMNGFIYINDKPVLPVKIFSPVDGTEIITNNEVISVMYRLPLFNYHISKPAAGVVFPEKSLSEKDIRLPPILWHEKSGIFGRKFSKRPRFKGYTPKNNTRKCFIGKKSLVNKDLCTESYFECEENMAHEISNCDGAMGSKDDVQMQNMSYVDDQTENKFHKKGGNHFDSNSAEQQATLHGAGNYASGENRIKKQSNNCDRPMGTKGADEAENKMQNARKRCRKSQKIIFTEQQPTADRIDNCMKDEDRMKQLRNKNDDHKFAETQQKTGGVVDKSINDRIKKAPSNSSNDPKFAEQQYRTEVVGEESRNNELNEDRMILQSNTSNDSTDKKIGSKRRKRRRLSKFAENQETENVISEAHINGKDRLKPQNETCGPLVVNKERKRKNRKRKLELLVKQEMVDGIGEESRNNELNEERMILHSNTSNDSADNKIRSKRRKRQRHSKFAEHQETENVITEAHINGKDRPKPQNETCGSLVVNKKRKRKNRKRKHELLAKQEMVDGVEKN